MSKVAAGIILRIASFAMLAFSAIWALAPYEIMNWPAILLIDLLDWPFDGQPAAFDRYDQWFSAVATSFLAGLALLFLLLVAPMVEQGSHQARRAGLIAIIVWFAMDSAGSIAAGVTVNALWNSMFVLPFIIPLALVRLNDRS